MMADTAFRSEESFTQQGFRAWLDQRPRSDINHYELINGRIAMTPPSGWPHSAIAATLVYLFKEHLRARGAGVILDSSAGYDLPSGDTVEPDISYLSADRFAAGPTPLPGEFVRIVPNLVVEILSRSTARRDRAEKKAIYERNGVDEYWLVDPDRRAVTVFRLAPSGYDAGRTFDTGAVHSQVLPELAVSLNELFAP